MKTKKFICYILILLIVSNIFTSLRSVYDVQALNLMNSKIKISGYEEKNAIQKNSYQSGISELDDNFWSSDTLGVGVFFSNRYEKDEDGAINKIVDSDIGLYLTNNGKDYIYIGETGITGRDPNIMYKDGVFYMATTKGGDNYGRVVVNIFKSTDLINWTNILDGIEKDEAGDTVYRYSIGVVNNNKYGMTTNTWSPKWFTDGNKTYILVSTSRFTEDGGALYYIDSNKKVLVENSLVTEEEYNNLNLDTSKGVLVKESAVLDKNGNAQYNKKGNLITKKEFCYDSNGKLVQAQCPFYTNSKYTLFDTYISEVISFGSEEEKTNVNFKNIQFGELQKINFEGFKEENSDGKKNLYYLHRSMLGGFLLKNKNDSEYQYAMYTKTDPFGTVQRWVSNSLTGKWYQVDDRYYVSQNLSSNQNNITCESTVKLSSHYDRVSNNIQINSQYDDSKVYSKHYEGSFIANFGKETLFYSDHYVTDENEVGTKEDENYFENLKNASGIYYSILENNSSDNTTDFGITEDHIRFNTFTRVNTLNMEMRPTSLQDSQLRNGGVFTINEAVEQEENINEKNKVKEHIKNVLRNAANFNIYTKYYTREDGNVTVVVKSNRAIRNKDNSNDEEKWVIDGWKYINEINEDISVDESIRNIYKTYGSTTPYSENETYLYKTISPNSETNLAIKDHLGTQNIININADTAKPLPTEKDEKEKNDEKVDKQVEEQGKDKYSVEENKDNSVADKILPKAGKFTYIMLIAMVIMVLTLSIFYLKCKKYKGI